MVNAAVAAASGGGGGGGAAGTLRGFATFLRRGPGRAVQVDPMNPMLKPPGTNLLKVNYDKLLSSLAFNFNLRRYTPVNAVAVRAATPAAPVGRCRMGRFWYIASRAER